MLLSRAASRQQWTRSLLASVWERPTSSIIPVTLRRMSIWLDDADDAVAKSPLDKHQARIVPKSERGGHISDGRLLAKDTSSVVQPKTRGSLQDRIAVEGSLAKRSIDEVSGTCDGKGGAAKEVDLKQQAGHWRQTRDRKQTRDSLRNPQIEQPTAHCLPEGNQQASHLEEAQLGGARSEGVAKQNEVASDGNTLRKPQDLETREPNAALFLLRNPQANLLNFRGLSGGWIGQVRRPPGGDRQSSTVKKGQQVSPLREGDEVSPLEKGQHLSPVRKGEEISPVEKGRQLSPMRKGEEASMVLRKAEQKSSLGKGRQPSPMRYTEENSMALRKGEQKSSLEKGQLLRGRWKVDDDQLKEDASETNHLRGSPQPAKDHFTLYGSSEEPGVSVWGAKPSGARKALNEPTTVAGRKSAAKNGEQLESRESGTPTVSTRAAVRSVRPDQSFVTRVEELLLGQRRPHEITRAGYSVKFDQPLDNLPKCKDKRAADDTLFAREPKFVAAARNVASFPAAELPEIAFAGRSNVGKSSLINALTRRAHVARVSSKPGETQSINFYNIGSRLSLVDLPGYGFAYAPDEKREGWTALMEQYLQTRKSLKRVLLMIDPRHGLKPRDLAIMELINRSRVRYQIVLTKADTLSPTDLARQATLVQEAVDGRGAHRHVSPLAMVSSRSGAGIIKLRGALSGLAVRL